MGVYCTDMHFLVCDVVMNYTGGMLLPTKWKALSIAHTLVNPALWRSRLAQESLEAELPEGWEMVMGEGEHEGVPFYYNEDLNESTWEHPLDEQYRQRYTALKAERDRRRGGERAPAQASSPGRRGSQGGRGRDDDRRGRAGPGRWEEEDDDREGGREWERQGSRRDDDDDRDWRRQGSRRDDDEDDRDWRRQGSRRDDDEDDRGWQRQGSRRDDDYDDPRDGRGYGGARRGEDDDDEAGRYVSSSLITS
jgi:hypothetical protein